MQGVTERLAVDAGRLQADERPVGRRTVLGEPGGELGEAVGVVSESERPGDRLAGAAGEHDGERLGGDVDADIKRGSVHR